MICKDCALGADLERDATENGVPSGWVDDLAAVLDVVSALHVKCAGQTWCDCQHRAPKPAVTHRETTPNQ